MIKNRANALIKKVIIRQTKKILNNQIDAVI